MARIVIDGRNSGTSTGRYVDRLAENLHRLKPDIDFIILAKTARLEFFKDIAPEFKVVRCDIQEFTFAEQYSYVWKLYGIKNNLVHFAMTQQPVLYFGRKITTIHDLTTAHFRNPAKNRLAFWIKQRVYRWVIKRVAKHSARIIVPSNYVKHQLAQFAKINPRKIHVIYEAADKITAKTEPVRGLKKGGYIMYVGRAQPHKNLKRLVEAFAIVRQTHPQLKLVLAGKKDILYERLQRDTARRGFKGVVFTGFISEGQLRWLYENTAAYVFPSLSEGFGLPALEAMVHGAPVISSNASCLPEIYGGGALYFDPLDVADIADKIALVLDDKRLSEKLAKAGRAQANKYSWRKTAEQTLELYKQAAE